MHNFPFLFCRSQKSSDHGFSTDWFEGLGKCWRTTVAEITYRNKGMRHPFTAIISQQTWSVRQQNFIKKNINENVRNLHKPRATHTNSRHIQTIAYRTRLCHRLEEQPANTQTLDAYFLRCGCSGNGTFADPTQKSKRAVMSSIWNAILKNWTNTQTGNTVVSACAINNEMKSRTDIRPQSGTAQDEQTTPVMETRCCPW